MLLNPDLSFFGMFYVGSGLQETVGHLFHLHIHTNEQIQELAQELGLGICRVKWRKQKTALEKQFPELVDVLFLFLH